MPTLSFSFFNPDTNNYKTVYTRPTNVKITNLEKTFEKVEAKSSKPTKHEKYRGWWVTGGLVLATIFLVIQWLGKNKKPAKPELNMENRNSRPTVTEILRPANTFSGADDKTFYNILRNCIWNYFTRHFGLTGSKMNKLSLSITMQQKKIDEKSKKAILEILEQCETGIFTNVESAGEKKKLLEETKEVLEKISRQFN